MLSPKGITIPELLLVLSLITFTLGGALATIQSVGESIRSEEDLHLLIATINKYRYMALEEFRSFRLHFANNRLRVEASRNGNFQLEAEITFSERTRLSANSSPLFSSLGFVVPACTIHISRSGRSFQLIISSTGRISVQRV